MRGKQSAKKGVWYIGGKRRKRRKQSRKRFPIGYLASAAAPILSEVTKSLLKKLSVVEKKEEGERKNSASLTSRTGGTELALRYIFPVQVRKNK